MANYPIAYSTNLWGCKCFSFMADEDITNGTLISKGDLVEGEREIYEAKYDLAKPMYLVLNPAWNYDDSTYAKKYDESTYTNVACVPFRGYELIPTRRWTVSTAITEDELAVGDLVVSDGKGKLKKTAADVPANAFLGKIIGVDTKGYTFVSGAGGNITTGGKFYVVEVVRNAVAAVTTSGGTSGTGI